MESEVYDEYSFPCHNDLDIINFSTNNVGKNKWSSTLIETRI